MKTPEEILKKHFIPYVCCEEYFKHCLDRKGEFLSNVTEALKAMEEYAQQFKYDFSKSCECGSSRIGETWCCNQCGLPVSKPNFKRCGEGENTCSCKSEKECGYLSKDI